MGCVGKSLGWADEVLVMLSTKIAREDGHKLIQRGKPTGWIAQSCV